MEFTRLYRAPDRMILTHFLPMFTVLAFGVVLSVAALRRSEGLSLVTAVPSAALNCASTVGWLVFLLGYLA